MKIHEKNQEPYIDNVKLLDRNLHLAVVQRPANEQKIWHRFLKGNSRAIQGNHGLWHLPVLIPERGIELHEPLGMVGRVRFSEQAVRQIAHAYALQGRPLSLGLEGGAISGSRIVESWLSAGRFIDKASQIGFPGLPKGTWMVGIYLPENALPKSWDSWGISLQAEFQTDDPKRHTSAAESNAGEENPSFIPLEAELSKLDTHELAWADEVARRLAHYQNGSGWASL